MIRADQLGVHDRGEDFGFTLSEAGATGGFAGEEGQNLM